MSNAKIWVHQPNMLEIGMDSQEEEEEMQADAQEWKVSALKAFLTLDLL